MDLTRTTARDRENFRCKAIMIPALLGLSLMSAGIFYTSDDQTKEDHASVDKCIKQQQPCSKTEIDNAKKTAEFSKFQMKQVIGGGLSLAISGLVLSGGSSRRR